MNMCHNKRKKFLLPHGFTLVELLVSLSVFSMVVVVASSAVLSLVRANQKVQAIKAVMENVTFALESMSRSIRFGSRYHCADIGNVYEPRDCPSPQGASSLAFADQFGTLVRYRLNGFTIERAGPDGVYIPITAVDAVITRLEFYVESAETATISQPKVKIIIGGYAGGTENSRSRFDIETTVSQRLISSL